MVEMLPRHYIWGILSFVLVIVGTVSILSNFNTEYADVVDQDKFNDFNASFDYLNDVTNEIDQIETSISGSEPDPGTYGVLNSLIQTSWQSLKLLFSSFSFMEAAYAALTTLFGVPAWIPGLITAAVIVLIAFAIWSGIFQTNI